MTLLSAFRQPIAIVYNLVNNKGGVIKTYKKEIALSWLESAKGSEFKSVFSLRENLFEDYKEFYNLFWSKVLLPWHVMELIRLRVAQLHDCQPELSLRYRFKKAPTELKIESLSDWHKDSAYTEVDRACLEIAELFVQDPHAISDKMAERAKAEIGDAGLVALMEWLALCDGFCRFQLMTGVSYDMLIRYADFDMPETDSDAEGN